MTWIDTTGGPLVVLPAELAPRWPGAGLDGAGAAYESVCSAEDYIGVHRWLGLEMLVLGDLPMQARLSGAVDELTITRWMYAGSEALLLERLPAALPGAPVIERLSWNAPAGRLLVGDSAISGAEWAQDAEWFCAGGPHEITTVDVSEGDDFRAIVHIIRRTAG
jgi:hypothetical protein